MKPANNEEETVDSVAYHNLPSAHTPYVRPKHLQVPTDLFQYPVKVVTEPRWKGKGSKAKALANPISNSISDLQSSLLKSNSQGILSGCSVLLATNPQQTHLLNQTCFGRPVITVDKHK
ncbi:putative tRNA-intron lyase [Helianthus annuus]|nr:putative tRNA-intron lyase [Helianthus annuus]